MNIQHSRSDHYTTPMALVDVMAHDMPLGTTTPLAAELLHDLMSMDMIAAPHEYERACMLLLAMTSEEAAS